MTIRPLFVFKVAAGLILLILSGCSGDDGNDVLVVPETTVAAPAATVVVTEAPPPTSVTRQTLFAEGAPAATDDCPAGLLDNNSSVSTVGLDEVLFGMTVAAASNATSACLVPEGAADRACHYVRPVGGPDGVGFMVTDGTCLLYTSPSPRDATLSRMPSSA